MKLTEFIALALSWAILGGLVVAFFFYSKKHQELPEDYFGDPQDPDLDAIPIARDVVARLSRVARFVGDEKKAPEDTEAIRLMKKWAQQDFNGGLPCGSAPCEGCPLTGDCEGKGCAEVVAWAKTELTKLGIDWGQG